jgi:hypothetical protein
MWQCVKCREQLEDSFDVCWNCGTARDGTEDPAFRKADDLPPPEPEPAETEAEAPARRGAKNPLSCPRCERPLDHVGTKSFHEGFQWGVLGDLGELFENRERFDVYCCPRCGRVEFFVDGIGEEFRPR